MASINLLSAPGYVEVPFVKVVIGDYVFGIYSKSVNATGIDAYGGFRLNNIRYPNYVQSLSVKKINGAVNNYTLKLKYQITENDDPNFFDKVFSSVSDTRRIVFSYGDLSVPSYTFRDEEAIITKVRQTMDVASSAITYTVSAVSTGKLASAGSCSFGARRAKPSDVIWELLSSEKYGLLEVFRGMTDLELVRQMGLIAGDDKAVDIRAKTNISAIDYLSYLVSCMEPQEPTDSLSRSKIYVLTYGDDTSGTFGGPYFRVSFMNKGQDMPTAYEIDIGYPSQNIVTSFDIEDDETYSLYYKFQGTLSQEHYVQRIDAKGNLVSEYAPLISSGTADGLSNANDRTWWSQATQYPIKATIQMKGLLRPAVLMSYVRINIYYYGKKHLNSGLYIVNSQTDQIDTSGYRTTLSLTRVGGDSAEVI